MQDEFLSRFHNRLNYYLDLMNQTWGFRPAITVSHEWLVRVGVVYPKGYAAWHNERKFYIKKSASGRTRSAHRIAAYVITPDYEAHKNKKYSSVPVFETAQAWIDTFKKEIKEAFKKMPTKPKIKIDIDDGLVIRVDFNLKGFAHKGQSVYCTSRTMTKHRKPESVARMFAIELTGHRNTCQQCGVGIAPLYHRIRGYTFAGNADVPPDQVEEVLHPRLSESLKARLEKLGV